MDDAEKCHPRELPNGQRHWSQSLVVDFRGKLVSVVMIIKWAFMTSWYDLKTAFRNRKCMKLNYISVYSLRVRKFVILYYEQHWQTEQSYANRFVLKIVFVGYNNN